MGDRFERKRNPFGAAPQARGLTHLRGKPPPEIIAWGLGAPATIGHNNGPPLDDDAPGYVWRRYCWKTVHAEVWKNPPLPILKFRMARAEAAGLSYRDYMLTLLDKGTHAQAKDRDGERTEALALIRATWADVIPRVAPDSSRMARGLILSSLIAAHDDDSRHYHNLVHIAAMLRGLATHGAAARDRDALALAILFHDAIYDATKSDNEAASARLAKLHLGDLGVAFETITRVHTLILATRHGEQPPADDPDMALLVDLDLAILAAAPERYAGYAAGVRREYGHVPDEAFRAGRAKVLVGFLARPRLYATASLAALWEAKARANLTAEIAALTVV
jgi:predicted metal-dependent HD superfamily phosphohydrolase